MRNEGESFHKILYKKFPSPKRADLMQPDVLHYIPRNRMTVHFYMTDRLLHISLRKNSYWQYNVQTFRFFFFLIMNFHKRYTYQLYMMFSKKCKLSWDLSATYSQKNNLYMQLQCKIHMPDILIVLVLIKVIINII